MIGESAQNGIVPLIVHYAFLSEQEMCASVSKYQKLPLTFLCSAVMLDEDK
jgi:hypothetical protein